MMDSLAIYDLLRTYPLSERVEMGLFNLWIRPA